MAVHLISNALVAKLKPEDKNYEIRDTKLKGFIMRVHKAGAISYLVQYARGKRITLGSAEVLTAAQARVLDGNKPCRLTTIHFAGLRRDYIVIVLLLFSFVLMVKGSVLVVSKTIDTVC